MTKKDTLSLLIILCLTSLLLSAAYFLTPHAVVRSPEHTQLSVIHMDSPNGPERPTLGSPRQRRTRQSPKKLWSIFPLPRNVIPSREPFTVGTPPIGM